MRTAPTSTGPTRSPRRSTCARRWTRSAATSWRAPRRAPRCRSCCAAGSASRRGLDELTREVWQRRSRLQRENRLDGTLQEVRELLQRALEAERDALARDDSDDARFREMQLDALPSDTGGAVRELDEYDWRSSDAREAYEEIRDLLGREMLDQRFAGMKQAMENATPAGRRADPGDARRPQRAARRARRGARTPPQQFAEFMQQHGEFFPENPQQHRGADRPARPAGRGRAADAQLDDAPSSAPS